MLMNHLQTIFIAKKWKEDKALRAAVNEATSYAENRSTVAANRLVIERVEQPGQLVKQLQPVRYLDENFSELYNQFPFRDELSKSSFVKYLTISGKFRKPHRLSDLCEYCETVRIFLSLFFLILSYLKNVSQ